MRPVSDAFTRVVRDSHVMRSRARLVDPGQTGTDPAGVDTPVVDGNVLLDGKAKIRATLDLTTEAEWPDESTDPLAPFGQECFVERGIQFGNGTVEWVSQGYYRIQDIEQAEAPAGAIRIAGRDRMSGIVDARLTEPRQFLANTTLGSVVDELVRDVYPNAVIEWDDVTDQATLGRDLVAERDRYEFLDELVTAAGKVWWFDYRGVLVIRTAPDPTGAPVTTVDHGEGGVLVTMGRTLTREGVYNAVVATGEAASTDPPVRAVAVDDNPESPTYFHGPFGPVPRFYSSPFITTTAQAESAARAILTRQLGLPYNVDFSAVPNPALEPLDPVAVAYPERMRLPGTRVETHVIEQLTVPLVAEAAMTAKTREQTLVEIGVL